ncbi:hypothetical protein VUR80DRAFT_8523 [Thermomyces stellatus]
MEFLSPFFIEMVMLTAETAWCFVGCIEASLHPCQPQHTYGFFENRPVSLKGPHSKMSGCEWTKRTLCDQSRPGRRRHCL